MDAFGQGFSGESVPDRFPTCRAIGNPTSGDSVDPLTRTELQVLDEELIGLGLTTAEEGSSAQDELPRALAKTRSVKGATC